VNPIRREQGIIRAQRVLAALRGMTTRYRDFYSDDGEIAKRMIKTRVPCSCPMCGNPRRHLGQKTVQERKADEAFTAAMEQLNE